MEELPLIHFLDIPDVVIQNHLFPLLRLNDLLRLRRTCKGTKSLAEEHLRLHHVNHPREIEITEEKGDKSLSAFLKMGIPAARIYLNNKSVKFFEHKDIPEFLELYADKITHLRVHHFFTFANKTEMPFYEALKNLRHLEFEEVDATQWRCDFKVIVNPDKTEMPRPPCPIASTFKNLRTLKFGHIEPFSKHDHGYWEDIVGCCCEHLEYLGHPLYDHPIPPQDPFGIPIPLELRMYPSASNNDCFKLAERLIEWRKEKRPGQPNLQFYDIGKLKDTEERCGSTLDFIMFLDTCYKHGVKVLNVDAELFQMFGPSEEKMYQTIVMPLVSVRNLNRALFQRELPSLEKVVVNATSKSTYYPFWMEHGPKPLWPKLKILDLTVDSAELEELVGLNVGLQETTELYEFLFKDIVRTELIELALRFDEKASRGGVLPCPKVVDLKASCPNLKILTLVNWTGTNKALSKLWDGLGKLEELTIQDCRGLGNVAFVGERKEQPSFLKLKGLKKLRLSGLDLMPKITDTAFSLVFRKMKLVNFFLESRSPLKTVSTSGIKSLLSGQLAGTIEKFPFSGWSLTGVSEKEFQKLEKEFRSYCMN